MRKSTQIEKLAKNRIVERLAKGYGLSTPYLKDLCQDIYIDLLKKDESMINHLCESNEIEFYIRKMIKNNVNSTTSPFYKNYEKFRKTTDEIQNEKTEEKGQT